MAKELRGSTRDGGRTRRLAAVVAGVMALGGAAGARAAEPGPKGKFWTELAVQPNVDLDAPVSMGAFASLAKQLSPAVVNIQTVRGADGGQRSFFGNPGGGGIGSGFIIKADGHVLTNYHVIRDADSVKIRLASDAAYPARVVGTFPLLDVALLKFEPDEPLTVAPLGDSTALAIGEWVVAIGSPFGLDHTVTAGIVSAKGRRDIVPGREQNLARFLQTDASINPGSSGGPLINIRGEVVGINTAINPSGQGIGFAVPINMVKTVLPQLWEGKVERSYLGVRFSAVPAEDIEKARAASGANEGRRLHRSAWVREVVANGPAAKAKLQVGDIIVAWNGVPLADWEEVSWLAATTGAGQKVNVQLLRGGAEKTVSVTLGAFPEEDDVAAQKPGGGDVPRAESDAPPATELGIVVTKVSRADQRKYKLSADSGVTVKTVASGSVAAALGMKPGDVIVRVNGKTLTGGPPAFEARVASVGAGELLAIEYHRGDALFVKAFTR